VPKTREARYLHGTHLHTPNPSHVMLTPQPTEAGAAQTPAPHNHDRPPSTRLAHDCSLGGLRVTTLRRRRIVPGRRDDPPAAPASRATARGVDRGLKGTDDDSTPNHCHEPLLMRWTGGAMGVQDRQPRPATRTTSSKAPRR